MAMTVVDKDCTEKAEDFTDHLLNMGYTKGMKDGYAKAIEEFAEAMKKKYPICTNDFGMVINESAHKTIDEIAKELKGE
jgi:flagellar biosynthesis/type III secretory pathway protein FliH